MRDAVSVSILMRYIKSRIDVDPKLASVRIKGEISNFVAHRSGHYYFSLKDEGARISCVMFASKASRCTLSLKDGMGVIVSGSISVYESTGTVQIYVNSVEEDG
ncbi:MAG: exodeoxyribonuclease VII large subunit, partial [Erysipelotrichales bacterium]|nr:exodeoxyribonuclease VII large subunit [Erysipelotrichales bacterium]